MDILSEFRSLHLMPLSDQCRYLGRKDNQVKINGHRIEVCYFVSICRPSLKALQLGEIENAILNTNIVDGCVVTVAQRQGKQQLAAFCIFTGDHLASEDSELLSPEAVLNRPSITEELTGLPEYMRPNIVLPFSSFSTLSSGKTDRKRLTSLAETLTNATLNTYSRDQESSESFRPIETEREEVMLEAWTSVLDDEDVTIGGTTSFASLGGDSIAAINVVAICRTLGWSITVNDVLSNKTLSEQAQHLKPAKQQEAVQELKYEAPVSVTEALSKAGVDVARDVEDIFPAGPGQIEFLHQGHNTSKQYWQLTVHRPLAADFDLHAWLEATKGLTARNQILRASYIKADDEDPLSWVQVILKSSDLDFSEVKYSSEQQKQLLIEALQESHFEFGKPAVKYLLLTAADDGSRTLAIKLHHASYDGTLLRIFDDQFVALAQGETDLPAVTEFKPFIDWNRRTGKDTALSYWTQLLRDYQPISSLPAQRTQNNGLKFAPVSAAVDQLATRTGATASTIFQAAYSILLSRLTSTTDVLYDNLLTGRNAEVANPQLVNGTCANFLPFRSRFNADTGIADFIHQTQSHFWETTEHGTVGLNDIYKALAQDRDVYASRMLFCFQPFEPAAGDAGQMHWIVFAISKVLMNINYLIMLEVQKTLKGYRAKLQYDADVFDAGQAEEILGLYNGILEEMTAKADGAIGDIEGSGSRLEGFWKG